MLLMGIFNPALTSVGIIYHDVRVTRMCAHANAGKGQWSYTLRPDGFMFRQQWFCSNIVLNVMGVVLL